MKKEPKTNDQAPNQSETEPLTDQMESDCDKAPEGAAEEVDYKNIAQRTQAEFDNFRKRNIEAVRIARQEGGNDVLLQILPVIDTIDIALSMITEKSSAEGVELIRKQLLSLLEKYDVKEIVCQNQDFNPELHNAVMREAKEGMAGKVLEVFQKGYERKGKVIRYAMVKVGE